MTAKGKKGELFDLCQKAETMKQIKIAFCQRIQKAVQGEIINKRGQISSPKKFLLLGLTISHFSLILTTTALNSLHSGLHT